MRPVPPAGPPPNEATLREAALRHLARYGTTQAGLLRVLDRRVQRWARAVGQAGDGEPEATAASAAAAAAAARSVVARLAAVGAVDDAAFAASRVRSLQRAGRSRRAIAAHLQAKGVPPDLAGTPTDPEAELAAALLYARRRRIGPFGGGPAQADPASRTRDLARMARAGFDVGMALRVLAMSSDEAEPLVAGARRY